MKTEWPIPPKISDAEHVALINRYREFKSMAKVARVYRRSTQTVYEHIKLHNRAVERMAECPRCMRGGDWWVALDFVEVNMKRGKNNNEETS